MRLGIQKELDTIDLNTGDIIVDHFTGYVGVLMLQYLREGVIEDNIYSWEIMWIRKIHKRNRKQIQITGTLEEDILKLSILVGAIELYSVKEENEHSLGN